MILLSLIGDEGPREFLAAIEAELLRFSPIYNRRLCTTKPQSATTVDQLSVYVDVLFVIAYSFPQTLIREKAEKPN